MNWKSAVGTAIAIVAGLFLWRLVEKYVIPAVNKVAPGAL